MKFISNRKSEFRPSSSIFNSGIKNDRKVFNNTTSVDTEMCYPKGKCGCQYFILLTLKKNKKS
jgi:hypothetical protein